MPASVHAVRWTASGVGFVAGRACAPCRTPSDAVDDFLEGRKMKTRLAVLAVLGMAAGANAQAFVSNIPGTFTDISTTGTLIATGDDSSGAVTVPSAASNVYFPIGAGNACTNGHFGYGGPDNSYF